MQRTSEPSDYEKGVAAGMEAMTMRQLQSQAQVKQLTLLLLTKSVGQLLTQLRKQVRILCCQGSQWVSMKPLE